MADSSIIPQRNQAYERLRRLLILRQIPSGERLREPVWAEELGVHRTALREAFARLEAEGFIEKGPKTGYFVPNVQHDDMVEIAEVRVGLESVACERICRLGLNTPEHLETLLEACEQLERMVADDYTLGVNEADRRFHEALIEASGNRRLAAIYGRAPLPIVDRKIVHPAEWLQEARRTLDEHRAILSAILQGDVSGAQALLQTHLTERCLVPLRGG